MSIKIAKNSVYLRNKNDGNLLPVAMFASGADVALDEISRIANEAKEEINQLTDTISNATDAYNTLQGIIGNADVEGFKSNLNTLSDFSNNGMIVHHDDNGYYIDTENVYTKPSGTSKA